MAHLKILEQNFDSLDKNRNGKLEKKEIMEFLVTFGFKQQYAEEFIKQFDANKDGIVSKDEFMKAACAIKPSKFSEAQLRAMFKKADKDHSGSISCKELKTFLEEQKNLVSKTEVRKWIEEHDKNKDKQLDYEEFLSFVHDKL
ncbi:hypothetical protein EG68_01479 [Paragonimus skrjabini miyazakii]|uniref:EF-hand domain-containing protein n=1 Tax=Paragonimus skrjabini miyazakii TaxID=59628 RepID=A0A8S9ZB52_9TREM|nr:hypothetical protein EG68_01479 [Paragonimus skrjabini miyazakii]